VLSLEINSYKNQIVRVIICFILILSKIALKVYLDHGFCMINQPTYFKKWLQTAGKSINCLRCTALSKRTKKQCGRPALKTSKTQKCQFHGGRGSGPKTLDGRERIGRAHLIHGKETIKSRQRKTEKALWFSQIEDVMHVIGMTSAPRQRGRKPNSYYQIKTLEEAKLFIEQDLISQLEARFKG